MESGAPVSRDSDLEKDHQSGHLWTIADLAGGGDVDDNGHAEVVFVPSMDEAPLPATGTLCSFCPTTCVPAISCRRAEGQREAT